MVRDDEDILDDLQKFFGATVTAVENSTKNDKSRAAKIESFQAEIEDYQKEKILITENVLLFWQKNKKKYKSLYRIACVYYQIPMTEVDVERLFSHVSFILNPLHASMSLEILNAIILIRLNCKLFEEKRLPLSL